MTLTRLRYFKAAAEELSLTRAAQALGVSQQALSSAVAALETRYRTRLFERTRAGLVLTPEGQFFYNYAVKTIAEEERMARELDEIRMRYTGLIRLGTTLTRSMTFLPEALAQFVREHPKIRLSMYVRKRRFELEKKLADNELDVIYAPLEAALPPGIRATALEKSWFCLTLPRSAIASILPDGQTLDDFAALPLDAQRELIMRSGLLDRLPCVYAGALAGRLAPRFMRRWAPENSAVISFADFENLISLPYSNHAAVFTYDSLARINLSRGSGCFLYYLGVPGSPFAVSLCYPSRARNPAVSLLVRALTGFAETRRSRPPEELFDTIG